MRKRKSDDVDGSSSRAAKRARFAPAPLVKSCETELASCLDKMARIGWDLKSVEFVTAVAREGSVPVRVTQYSRSMATPPEASLSVKAYAKLLSAEAQVISASLNSLSVSHLRRAALLLNGESPTEDRAFSHDQPVPPAVYTMPNGVSLEQYIALQHMFSVPAKSWTATLGCMPGSEAQGYVAGGRAGTHEEASIMELATKESLPSHVVPVTPSSAHDLAAHPAESDARRLGQRHCRRRTRTIAVALLRSLPATPIRTRIVFAVLLHPTRLRQLCCLWSLGRIANSCVRRP